MTQKIRLWLFLILVIIAAGAVGFFLLHGFKRPTATSPPAQVLTSGPDTLYLDFAGIAPPPLPSEPTLFRILRDTESGAGPTGALKIDYPFADSIFPPDLIPPTFLFHDLSAAKIWFVDLEIAGEPGHLFILTDGRRAPLEIDPRCPSTRPESWGPDVLSSANGWTPSPGLWAGLVLHPEKDITLRLYGSIEANAGQVTFASQGRVRFKISRDPVGAPIFYRDVPLMPTANVQGVVMPLAEENLPLIEWRLRDLSQPHSVVVLKDMPTCANCHSFSKDGKFLGMDIDTPNNDKGSYALAPVQKNMVLEKDRLITWSSYNPRWLTFGLFSRVSPDGRYVISSVNEKIFVANYLDVGFLQTFYPTAGILAVYDRQTHNIVPLPGAADPRFVQANAVWTPDGQGLVFIRAKATSNIPSGEKPPRANDPREIQIQYNLYSIPFADGRGGEAKPLPGASGNGKSNAFPKISPDGRWIVWVEAQNGLLMRPDSELYIMPLSGGPARRMACNLGPMNSWHSWSPNSRWLVFSSKAFGPYTQMFLTHIDDQGNDSPAVLVPHATAANRAVNIPEFINIKSSDLVSIDVPAIDYRRHLNKANDLLQQKNYDDAFKELQLVEEMKPGYRDALALLGVYYREKGDPSRAIELFEKSLALDPTYWPAHNFYAVTLARLGKYDDALRHFQLAARYNPFNAQIYYSLGALVYAHGDLEKARVYLLRSLEIDPKSAKSHFGLGLIDAQDGQYKEALSQYETSLRLKPDDVETVLNLAWLLAACPDAGLRNAPRAQDLAKMLQSLSQNANPRLYDILAAAYAEDGRFELAVQMAETAVRLTGNSGPDVGPRRQLLEIYKAHKPYPQEKK